MSQFLSAKDADLEEYVPGEQPKDQQYIKLNTNESPFAPSPHVLDAISREQAALLHLYPDPDSTKLTEALAAYYRGLPENIMVSNGSDGILYYCFMGFCDAHKPHVFPAITYGLDVVYSNLL